MLIVIVASWVFATKYLPLGGHTVKLSQALAVNIIDEREVGNVTSMRQWKEKKDG